MRKLLKCLSVVTGIATALAVTSSSAQETAGSDIPTRYPASGVPILNCEPSAPAPENTCFLRILPGYQMQDLDSDPLGDVEGRLRATKPGSRGFPDDVNLSATLILVDLSPGPQGGRRVTFETERALIVDIVRGLPNGELVSVYGFNESLQRLVPFSDDRDAAITAVEGLELQGSNTRIGAFVTDGISILKARDDVLMRNLILITDGQEEGRVDVDGVIEQAIEAEVVVSAVGMFWRPVGSGQTSSGMDYLRVLSGGTSGAAAQAILRNRDAATENVDQFVDSFSDAIAGSRLIVPEGDPQPTAIKLELGEPALGAEGEFTTREVVVRFQPLLEETEAGAEPMATDEAEAAETEDMIYGYPAFYVYIAGAVLGLLLLLLLIILATRGRKSNDAFADGDDDGLDFAEAGPVDIAPPAPPTVAIPRASAYLVFEGTQRRVGITGDKSNVGRSATNDVVIEVEGISRLHAQIFRNRDGGYSVTDMDSLNGTFVNGKKVSGSMKVLLGDTVSFGTVKAKLVSA